MRRTNARPRRRLHYTHGQLINRFYALHLARLNSWSRKTEGKVKSVLWMIYKFNTTEWGQSPVLPTIIDILPCSSSSCSTNKELFSSLSSLSKACAAGLSLIVVCRYLHASSLNPSPLPFRKLLQRRNLLHEKRGLLEAGTVSEAASTVAHNVHNN